MRVKNNNYCIVVGYSIAHIKIVLILRIMELTHNKNLLILHSKVDELHDACTVSIKQK